MTIRLILETDFRMKKLFYFLKLNVFLIVIILVIPSLRAQEYPTDRIFMKQFKKTKCLRAVDKRVNSMKTRREMTLEHEVFLNNNIWNRIRTKLPLSPGELKRLFNLRENGFAKKKLSSKKLWAEKEKEFKVLRSKCK